MKKFLESLKGGFGFGLGILITLFVGSVIASLNSVELGDTLTASKWNELVGNVNSLNSKLENLINESISFGGLNDNIEVLSSEIDNLKNQNASLNSITPQGAVIAFNLSSCPNGWLPANGENGTPDLRGRFIRGLGGNENGEDAARALGSYQGDAIRNITGDFQAVYGGDFDKEIPLGAYTGPFSAYKISQEGQYTQNDYSINMKIGFNASNVVPTSSDNRPKNIALIYCIKE